MDIQTLTIEFCKWITITVYNMCESYKSCIKETSYRRLSYKTRKIKLHIGSSAYLCDKTIKGKGMIANNSG